MKTIAEDILNYKPFNEEEDHDKLVILDFISKNENAFYRENPLAHMTASAWIVNYERTKVLMAYHNIYHSWSWLGDRDFIIPVRGYIKAGYDLRKIKNLKIEGDVLSMSMPDPQIELQHAEPMYNQAVSNVGIFRSEFTQKEESEIIKEGVELLKQRVEDLDLVPQAEEQARAIMESLVRQMGYEPSITFPSYKERNIKKMIKLGSDLTKPKTQKKKNP